jgi:uncharacterized integral membrane protein (TIGR00697 family)
MMHETTLRGDRHILAERYYLILAGIFIASLVACNLIFQKFFAWALWGWYTFEISVGILPYPITFLCTDIISEVYGRRRADQVVTAGLVASIFVLGVVVMADVAPATAWSPVKDSEFSHVFGLTGISVAASMAAYLVAQYIDIRIYHFWKEKTNGRHLWLRNNASTITSQFIDTVTVLLILCGFGIIEWERFGSLLENGFLFKLIVALCDTPFLYLSVWFLRRQLGLKGSEEVAV